MVKNRLNKKAFTLVEIVIAIAILAVAAIGIGSMIVGARNNSQKQLNESELQQQLVEVQESLRNDILATNAGVKYWKNDGSGYVTTNGSNDNGKEDKLLAMYAIDYLDYTITKTYVKYDANDQMLYKTQIISPITIPTDGSKITIDETTDEILANAQDKWDVYAQEVQTFSMDLSKYSQNNTVNYNVNVTNDSTEYNSDNTVKVRNEIAVNSAIDVDPPNSNVSVPKPMLNNSRFEYNGQERTPREVNLNSRYVEKSGVTSATVPGVYEITYKLKNPNATWEDGTKDPWVVQWIIEQRRVTVTWGQLTWVYDGVSQHSTTVSLGNIVPGDVVNPTLSNNLIGPGVGTQDVILTIDNTNYTVAPEDEHATLSITKDTATFSQIPTAKDLTYNGNPQELVNPGVTTHGTVVYSLNKTGPFAVAIPTGIDSNNETPYVVYYYIQGDADHDDSAVDSLEVIIKRADPTVTPPTPISPIYYDLQSHVLIKAGSSTGGTMVYNCDGGDFSADLPTGVNAGTYKVGFKSLENANYKESAVDYVDAVISKSAPTYTKPQGIDGLVYNGKEQVLVIPGVTADGAWEYNVDGGDWSTKLPAKIPAKDSYVVGIRLPATEDYSALPEEFINVKIDKAPATCIPPTKKPDLIYNAMPQTLIEGGRTNDGTLYYGFTNDTITMSQELPSQTDVGKYPIYYYVMGDENHYDSAIGTVEGEIMKQKAEVSLLPRGLTLVYNGLYQELLDFGGQPEGGNGTMVFTLTPSDDASWSPDFPEKIDAGVYEIYYKVQGNENFSDSDICATPIVSEIKQAKNAIIAPEAIPGLVYTGEAQVLATPGSAEFGVMEYSLDEVTWQSTVPSHTEAGIHTVYYRVIETPNYTGVYSSVDCFIAKAQADITPPIGLDLTYNGSYQDLITKGSANPGVLEYRIDGTDWSEDAPQGLHAQTYTVEYRVNAGPNYDNTVYTVNAIIRPGKNSAEAPTAKDLHYNGTAQELVNPGVPKWGTMEYSLDNENWSTEIPTATEIGPQTVFWRVPATQDYSEINGKVDALIDKMLIEVPEIIDKTMSYTGSVLTPTLNYDNTWVSASGQLSATDFGTYYIDFTLLNEANTKWADGITDITRKESWNVIKGEATVITPPVGNIIDYNGEEQTLLESLGSSDSGVIKFRLQGEDDSAWTIGSPVGKDAGDYIIEYKVFGDTNHYDSDIKTVMATILPIYPSYEAPDIEVFYDGQPHGGTVKLLAPDTATVTYGVTQGSYSATAPTWTNVGLYTTYFKIEDSSPNYKTLESSFTVKILAVAPTYTSDNLPGTIDVVYNGNPYTLLTAPKNNPTTGYWEYSLDGSDWSTDYPQKTNAGEYPILLRLVGDANHKTYYESGDEIFVEAGPITSYIRRANPTYTAPIPQNRVYNEMPQTLYIPGISTDGKFEYTLVPNPDENTPIGTVDENGVLVEMNAGTYTVYWKFEGDENHTDVPVQDGGVDENGNQIYKYNQFDVTISPATPTVTLTPINGLVYNENPQMLCTASVYPESSEVVAQYSLDNNSWSYDFPSAVNAGNYTVYYKVTSTDPNWKSTSGSATGCAIAKADVTCIAPKGQTLTYTGASQSLIEAGSAVGGTMYYRLGTAGIWTEAVPTASAAGTYVIYFYVKGDLNHNDMGAMTNPIGFVNSIIEAPGIAQAIYCASDGSLTFIRNSTIYSAGSRFNGKTVTNVYTGFETEFYYEDGYNCSNTTPWNGIKENIKKVIVQDAINPTSIACWFEGFRNCQSIDVTNLNTSEVTDMSCAFKFAGYDVSTPFKITGLNNWDVSKTTNMYEMFYGTGKSASDWNIGDLSNWDVSNVRSMAYLFWDAGRYAPIWTVGDLSNWDTSNVMTLRYMFANTGSYANAWSVGDLSTKTVTANGKTYIAWDISNVTSLAGMFDGTASGYTGVWSIGNIGNWNTSKVTSTTAMFQNAGAHASTWYIGDLSNWDMSQNTNMCAMFAHAGMDATSWSIGDLSNWNTSNVTDLGATFAAAGLNASTFSLGNLDTKQVTVNGKTYTAWDTSKVTDMWETFFAAGANATSWYIGTLSNWNTSNVTTMWAMFNEAGYRAATFNIGNLRTKTVTVNGSTYTAWDVRNVTDMDVMFGRAGYYSSTFVIGDISNWNTANCTTMGYSSPSSYITEDTWATGMFQDAGKKASYYLNLSGWNVNKVQDHLQFNTGVTSKVIAPKWVR